jgi:hypothetical protein
VKKQQSGCGLCSDKGFSTASLAIQEGLVAKSIVIGEFQFRTKAAAIDLLKLVKDGEEYKVQA